MGLDTRSERERGALRLLRVGAKTPSMEGGLREHNCSMGH